MKAFEIKEVTLPDGGLHRTTITDSLHDFTFLGDIYNIKILKNAEPVHIYYNSSNSELSVWRDKYGRLFLKSYQEEMCFSGDEDRMEYTCCFIAEKAQADALVAQGSCLWMIEPFIYYDCIADFVSAQEVVNS